MNTAKFCKNSEIILSKLFCIQFIFLVCPVSPLHYCSLHDLMQEVYMFLLRNPPTSNP